MAREFYLIHVFYGADDFSIHEALDEIKKGLGDASMLSANTTRLEGAKLRTEELECAVQSVPFFGEKRLVIIDGLLGRFEPKEKRGAAKKAARPPKESEAELHKTFASLINATPESSILVLLNGEIGKSNVLLKEISPKADIRLFAPLKGMQLESWAKKRVSQAGGTISEDALKNLVRLVGSDLWVMKGEIEKLVLYAGERSIEAEDVKKLVGLSREASIFTLVDAIVDGRLGLANQTMNEMLESGAAPSYVLVMLARQLRLLVRAKELKNSGQSESAIQGALGLGEFPFRKTLEQASRYTMSRLKDFYHRLLDTDLAIKTGKYDDELALTILVSELCSQNK
ncbi:MAG: DNA polymerase III subunit delta [Dehalococcoidia bacterium]|nr:MAG: DNA polymerase III subunit delta [Dehalococcoidia bacterium]